MKEYHPLISSLSVGILLSSYQIAILITAPFVSKMSQRFGRKHVVIYGLITMSLSTLVFAIASFIKNSGWFYTVSLIARFI